MPIEPLVILGAGGHAEVVVDALLCGAPGASVQVMDDDPLKHGKKLCGVQIVVPIGRFDDLPVRLHIAIGDNLARSKMGRNALNSAKVLATIVHPGAIISSSASVGAGTFVAAGAVIAPNADIGVGAIINHGAIIDHDCVVGAWAHVAPGATLGGAVRVGEQCLIGSGAIVLPGLCVGHGAVVGSGAVVTRNVPPGETVIGVPARGSHEAG